MKPTVEELDSINPALQSDQDYAVDVASRLNDYFGDGECDHYATARQLLNLLGSKEAVMAHLAKSLPDWQPGDLGFWRLTLALIAKAEREITGLN